MAQILAAIYEPIFRPCSYGFRPHRNPIQALHHVAQAYRAGATWIIEGDLVKCFDAIPHHVIVQCLRKRIKDERFLDLVRQMLTAGVMEEGTFLPTYSGTPQGGLASPVLCNVVLHELDCWMEEQWQANPAPLTPKQQYARTNPEYARHKRNLVRWRAQLRGQIPMGRQTPEGLRTKIKHALTPRKQLPSVLPRRLISYCRYADDYVVVLCQYSKAEAQHLKTAMAQWLEEHLGLTQHPEKTHITHWDRRFRFLGYDLRGQRNPHGTRWLRLTIPPEKERALKVKVKRLCRLYPDSRTRSLHECQCTHARLDAVLPLCPQCAPPFPVSHRGGLLADGALSGAETSLLDQTDHAHRLRGGSGQSQTGLIHLARGQAGLPLE